MKEKNERGQFVAAVIDLVRCFVINRTFKGDETKKVLRRCFAEELADERTIKEDEETDLS